MNKVWSRDMLRVIAQMYLAVSDELPLTCSLATLNNLLPIANWQTHPNHNSAKTTTQDANAERHCPSAKQQKQAYGKLPKNPSEALSVIRESLQLQVGVKAACPAQLTIAYFLARPHNLAKNSDSVTILQQSS